MSERTRREMLKLAAGAVATIPLLGQELRAASPELSSLSSTREAKATFYVATNGDDAWSGRLSGGQQYPVRVVPLKTFPFEKWRQMGYDQNSMLADPLFIDPVHDDYRLRPESSALTLGFKPIDVTKIGIRKDPHRR